MVTVDPGFRVRMVSVDSEIRVRMVSADYRGASLFLA